MRHSLRRKTVALTKQFADPKWLLDHTFETSVIAQTTPGFERIQGFHHIASSLVKMQASASMASLRRVPSIYVPHSVGAHRPATSLVSLRSLLIPGDLTNRDPRHHLVAPPQPFSWGARRPGHMAPWCRGLATPPEDRRPTEDGTQEPAPE